MNDFSKIDGLWFKLSEYLDSIYYLSETAWQKVFHKTYLPCDTIMTPDSFFKAVEVSPSGKYFYFGYQPSELPVYLIFQFDASGLQVVSQHTNVKTLVKSFLKTYMPEYSFQCVNKKGERKEFRV
jgi:hypothetical protein